MGVNWGLVSVVGCCRVSRLLKFVFREMGNVLCCSLVRIRGSLKVLFLFILRGSFMVMLKGSLEVMIFLVWFNWVLLMFLVKM